MSRSVLKKIQLSLLALGLLGGGIVACGDDPAPAPQTGNSGDGDSRGDGDDDEGDGDSGDGDEGDGDGDAAESECMSFAGGIMGRACSADGVQGVQLCENGEATGDCRPIQEWIASLSDGGLFDFDASVPDLGDAGSAECPSSMMCEKLGGQLGDVLAGLGGMDLVMLRDGIGTICETSGTPPTCTDVDDCKTMGLPSAACVTNPLSALGVGGAMICMQKCEP